MPPESFIPLEPGLLTSASPWGIPVRVLGETTSSNDELLRAGEEGAPSGTMLFAEHQSAGRGRHRRHWFSAPGLGLWFSLLLRMPVRDATIPLLSAFAAVALTDLIRDLGIAGCGIKAPNDVLVHHSKVAGILVETRTGSHPFAVVGIGLNVLHAGTDFPEELRDRAGSLAMASGIRHDRNAVAAALIAALGNREHQMRADPGLLLSAWDEMLLPDSSR